MGMDMAQVKAGCADHTISTVRRGRAGRVHPRSRAPAAVHLAANRQHAPERAVHVAPGAPQRVAPCTAGAVEGAAFAGQHVIEPQEPWRRRVVGVIPRGKALVPAQAIVVRHTVCIAHKQEGMAIRGRIYAP